MSEQSESSTTLPPLALEEVDGLLGSSSEDEYDDEIPPLCFDRSLSSSSTLSSSPSCPNKTTSTPQDALNLIGRSPSPVAPRAEVDGSSRVDAAAQASSERAAAHRSQALSRAPIRTELEDDYDFDMDADLAMAEGEDEDEDATRVENPRSVIQDEPPIDLDQEEDGDEAASDVEQHLASLRRAATQLQEVMLLEDEVLEVEDEEQMTHGGRLSVAPGGSDLETVGEASDVGARLALHGVGQRRAPAAQSSNDREAEIRAVTSASSSSSSEVDPLIGIDGIPKYIPAGTFGATAMSGDSVRFERRKRMRGWKAPPPHYGKGSTGLLSEPAYRLLQKAEMAAAEAVVQSDERLAARRAKLAEKTDALARSHKQGCVWVEKYRPKRYTELLGDDRTHRDVMSWLKSWDACVFKRRAKKRARDEASSAANDHASGYYGRRNEPYSDAWNRPEQRILMLSGPPGLGKTTLAHVIANSCGYAVHELNASDARNSAAVEDRVKVALESGAALGDDRPTCVVIDEIDGATGGSGEGPSFIKSLVKLVEMGSATGGARGVKGKKKKKAHRPLLRPIICICNDLYAPALRPLRPLARLVRVNKPAANHLVARLRTVCEAEGLTTDTRALNLLAELADGDVRSCLNALQLAKAKGDTLQASQLRDREGNVLAVKDGGSSTAKVFELLFRTPTPKERARGIGAKDGHEMMARIVDEVVSCGEQERLLHGCFEHYPSLRLVDDGLGRFKKIHEWMAWNQNISEKGWELGTHELAPYLPWAFAPWHFLFANTANELPGFAKADYQNHLKRNAFDEVAAELYASLPPGLRIMFGKEAVITELGPALMRMLSPDLRPINAQISRPGEKEILAAVVNILISLGMSMQQDRTEEGQLVMRLEPALDAFVQYEGKRSKEVGPARYAIRSVIAKEVEAVKMRIKSLGVDGSTDESGGPLSHEELAARAAAGAIAVYKSEGVSSDPTTKGASSTATLSASRKAAVDFFGRKVVPPLLTAKTTPAPLVAPEKLAEVRLDQAAIRETEVQVAKKKAVAAQQAAPLPSLLLERRAAKAAAEGAAHPHVRMPAATAVAGPPDAKRQRVQAA